MKHIYLLLFALFTLGSAIAQIPTEGLIAYYPFNGNSNDESGNAYHAVNYGCSMISDRFSKSSSACGLSSAQYLTLPQSFDLKPRSINLWFNAAISGNAGWQMIYSSDNPGLNNGMAYISVFEVNNKPELHIACGNARDTVDISRNAWYNVHLQLGSDSIMAFYLNGYLLSRRKYTYNLKSVDGFNNVVIGASRSAANSYFKGLIDDIRIYNRNLIASEIESIYFDGSLPLRTSICDTLKIQMGLSNAGSFAFNHTFKIYPNPAKSSLFIDFGQQYTEVSHLKIKIYNSLGQTIHAASVNSQLIELNLSAWTGKGMYILEICESHGKILERKKIILN